MSFGVTEPQPLRLGVVGCGGARRVYGPVLRALPSLQPVAVLDPDLSAARAWQKQLGAVKVHTESDPFFTAGLDAVLITAPPAERPRCILEAASRGVHLLCEPPAAPDLFVLAALQTALPPSAGVVLCAFPWRYDPVLEYAGSLIDEGSLGRIVQLRVDIAASLPNEDTRSAHRSWPGLITESAVHVFDLAARWLGPIEGVTADVDLPEKGRETGSGCIILHHAAAETVLQVVRMRRRAVSEQIVITGTAGTVHLVQTEPGSRPGSAPWRGTVRMNDAAAEEIAVSADAALMEFLRFNHPGHRMLSAFAEAVASDPCSREGISDSRRVLEILAAAWLSAPKSQRVLLPLSVGEDLQRHLALWS